MVLLAAKPFLLDLKSIGSFFVEEHILKKVIGSDFIMILGQKIFEKWVNLE